MKWFIFSYLVSAPFCDFVLNFLSAPDVLAVLKPGPGRDINSGNVGDRLYSGYAAVEDLVV